MRRIEYRNCDKSCNAAMHTFYPICDSKLCLIKNVCIKQSFA